MLLTYIVSKRSPFVTVRDIAYNHFCISKRYFAQLKSERRVFCNGTYTYADKAIVAGDKVVFDLTECEECFDLPEEMDLDILYEDDLFLAVNKPPQMLVHTTRRELHGTVANGVAAYFNRVGVKRKVRILNRLDRDTTGVCLIAKHKYAQEYVKRQSQNGLFYKEYRGVVLGSPLQLSGVVDAPIVRSPKGVFCREIGTTGKSSQTHYEVVAQYNSCTLLSFTLYTGRTHQIRLHMSSLGHPLAGDPLYGRAHPKLYGQALYCSAMKFDHPVTKKSISIVVSLPEDISNFLS